MATEGSPALVRAPAATAALMLAVFTVSVGYGVVLPLLPYLVEQQLRTGAQAAELSRHTGLLTGAYSLAMFLFAPFWGRRSDRQGRRGVLAIGLAGFGGTMAVFSLARGLPFVYASRFLSGLFAAAVTPIASAAVSDLGATEDRRGRRLALVNMSGLAGFLLGPMIGVSLARAVAPALENANGAAAVPVALSATALPALLVSVLVMWAVPEPPAASAITTLPATGPPASGRLRPVSTLLWLSFVVSMAIGVFEVGLALRAKETMTLSPNQLAIMFTECSLVMIVVQAAVFSPWIKVTTTRWFLAPAFLALAAGLAFVPRASGIPPILVAVAIVAASAGILSPVVTYWISTTAGRAQGWRLGSQTAAGSLGVTVGSAAGGLLFNSFGVRDASFALAAGLALAGFVASLRLPRVLISKAGSGSAA